MELIVRKFFQNYPRNEIIADVLRAVSALADQTAQRETWLLSLAAAILCGEYARRFSPPLRYKCRLLRDLIAELEKCDCEEPVPALYYHLYRRLSDSPLSSSTEGWVSYWLHDRLLAVIREDTSLLAAHTTGVRTWQAAKTMVEWFSVRPEWIAGKHVLELGAGLGFLGIAVCRSCRPQSFTLTDAHPFVMKRLVENVIANSDVTLTDSPDSVLSETWMLPVDQQLDDSGSCHRLEQLLANVNLTCDSESFDPEYNQTKSRDGELFDTNGVQPISHDFSRDCANGSVWYCATLHSAKICVQWLDWCEIDRSHVAEYDRVDLVLAADVSYSLSLHAPLCRTLSLLLQRRQHLKQQQQQQEIPLVDTAAPLCILLALTERNADTMQSLFNEMSVHGLCVTLLSTPCNIQSELRMDESSKVKIFSVAVSADV